ncbi:MAG: aldo/keto reductase, partial [Pseudomonadota bacterium]
GRWLKARGHRDDVIIATKVTGRSSFPWMRENGGEARMTRDQIDFAVNRSLKNLQTDYIDLYQLHWPDRPVQNFGAAREGYAHYDDKGAAFADILDALGDQVKAGKIRYVGLSNETPYGVMRFLSEAETKGLPRMASIQNAYSLVNRTFETGLAEIALEEEVGLLAYSPMAQGALTGKYLGGKSPAGSRGALFSRLGRYQTPMADEAFAGYVSIAKDFGIDAAAFALQFVTTRPFVTSNIFGASSLKQLEVVFSSLDFNWSSEMENAVNELHGRIQNPCP